MIVSTLHLVPRGSEIIREAFFFHPWLCVLAVSSLSLSPSHLLSRPFLPISRPLFFPSLATFLPSHPFSFPLYFCPSPTPTSPWQEIVGTVEVSDIDLPYVMHMLSSEEIEGLPPGGGLSAKRALIETKLNTLLPSLKDAEAGEDREYLL